MIRFIKIVGITLAFALIAILVQKIFFNGNSVDKDVADFVKVMNKTCPDMIDPETRLDKVIATSDKNLQFNYTLVHMIKDSIPIISMKRYMEPVIIEKIRSSGTLRRFMKKNLTWIYSYSDRKGVFVFKVTYTPEMI
jgi:hypothetical protein